MSLFASLFSKRKSDQAIDALKTQFNIDLYESGHFQTDRRNKYKVSISDTDDCIAVINRGRDNILMAKEWYLLDKKGSLKQAAKCAVVSGYETILCEVAIRGIRRSSYSRKRGRL